jgi:hypothetical protein
MVAMLRVDDFLNEAHPFASSAISDMPMGGKISTRTCSNHGIDVPFCE